MINGAMRIAFRVDATSHSGLGHLTRCVVLGNFFHLRGWDVHFISSINEEFASSIPDFIEVHFSGTVQANCVVQKNDAEFCRLVLDRIGGVNCLICDSYMIDHIWQNAMFGYVDCLVTFDDVRESSHMCDIIISDNLYPIKKDKILHDECRLLQGLDVALIDDKFFSVAPKNLMGVSNIFVSFGATEKTAYIKNVLKVLDVLIHTGELSSALVVNIAVPNKDGDILSLCSSDRRFQVTLHQVPCNMLKLLEDADLVYCAAGNTLLECIAANRPAVATIVSNNQRHIAHALNNVPIIQVLGDENDHSVEGVIQATRFLLRKQNGKDFNSFKGSDVLRNGCEAIYDEVLRVISCKRSD